MVSSPTSPFSSRSRLLLLLTMSSTPAQGFTMFEVLVALLASFFFLTGTLNAMVVSTIFQVKAERQAQANYWIQDDLETIRASAASFTPSNSATACTSGMGSTFNSESLASLAKASKPATKLLDGYRIDRSPSASGNITGLTYRVHQDKNNNDSYDSSTEETTIVAQLYTEVLPEAALGCP